MRVAEISKKGESSDDKRVHLLDGRNSEGSSESEVDDINEANECVHLFSDK